MPDQRNWLIGAGVALAALVVVAVLAMVWRGGDPEATGAPDVDVLAAIALAEGGATAGVPDCVIVDRGALVGTTPRGAECAIEDAPAFALAADAPASVVVGWSPRPASLAVLTRVPPGADPGLARFDWADDADASALWIVDDADGDVLLAPGSRAKVGTPADAGWRDAVKAARDAAPKAPILLAVRSGWTTQDLVRRCDALVALGAGCRLGTPTEAVLARLAEEDDVGSELDVKVARRAPAAPDTLKGTIKANQSQARFCYESRKRVKPSLSGRVEIAWTLRGGKPTSARVVSDTTGDPKLGECIVEKSKRWAFPLDLDEATAPFVFKP